MENFDRTFKIMRNYDNNFKEENGKKFVSFQGINWNDEGEEVVKTIWIELKDNKFEMLRQDLGHGIYKIKNIISKEIYWVSQCEWYNSFRETTTDELLLSRVKEKIDKLEVELVQEISKESSMDKDFVQQQRIKIRSLKEIKGLIELVDVELEKLL